MARITIISDEVRTVDGSVVGDQLTIVPELLVDAIGWELKPQGLCRGDTCVPVRSPDALATGGRLDLAAVATALGRPAVIDAPAGLAAIALDAEARRQALDARQAPSFTLDDLDGNLHALEEWHDRKKLLVAFSTW